MKQILIRNSEIIKSRHIGGVVKTFLLQKNGQFFVNGREVIFDSRWNKHRHILGIMSVMSGQSIISNPLN